MLFKKKANNKVILVHHNNLSSIAFDVFYPKNFKIDPRLEFQSYDMPECPFVQKSKLKEYYRFSGDLDHIPEINKEVAQSINKLIKDYGFTVMFAEDGWEEKKK